MLQWERMKDLKDNSFIDLVIGEAKEANVCLSVSVNVVSLKIAFAICSSTSFLEFKGREIESAI